MGKTPAQENRAKAKKQGMSHEDVKKQEAAEAHKLKKLANENQTFGQIKGAAMNAKHEKAKEKLREMHDPSTAAGKAYLKAQRQKQKEQMEFLLRKGKMPVQPELEEGQDPKSVMCEFFKAGVCNKGDRCKFSHDSNLSTRKSEKCNIYDDDEDSIATWDQEKLEAVVNEKHGDEANQNNETTIICKHFLEAIEKSVYGWFWVCPGGGKDCRYRHKLPPGYVFESERRRAAQEAFFNRKTDTDILEEELEKLKLGEQTPVTEDNYLDWKKMKDQQRADKLAAAAAERKKTNQLTGRELVESGSVKNDDDDGGAVVDFAEHNKQRREEEDALERQMQDRTAAALREAKAEAGMDLTAPAGAVEGDMQVDDLEAEDVAAEKAAAEEKKAAADKKKKEQEAKLQKEKEERAAKKAEKATMSAEDKEAAKLAKKKAAEEKRAARKADKGKGKGKKDEEEIDLSVDAIKGTGASNSTANIKGGIKRTVTGVLASRPAARDIKIVNFTMAVNGRELVQECNIELTIGRRYGLLGQNGSGKTNFLECLAAREVPIPDHIDLYHLREEHDPTDRTAIQAVVDEIKDEMARLQKMEELIMETVGPEDERLEMIYERLDELDPTTFETRAAELLHGLGFTTSMMHRMTKDMSGGWRMRVALAKALFAAPTLLLLDEPTNHLDLGACVWLEEYLMQYKKCLIITSHSQDFLNGVCTHIIWLTKGKLTYYTGNYDSFQKTVREDNIIQQKKHEKEQADLKHLKEFIASCGTYSNMVKQAQSKQKIIDKMMAAGLTPPVTKEPTWSFRFPDTEKVPPPVLPFADVCFSYSGKPEEYLYENLELGVDCDSRVALVGPNGAGKSTLLKLMTGELTPCTGTVSRHTHLKIGKYHQHSVDVLDRSKTVLQFFMDTYPNNMTFTREVDEWRAFLGRYGLSGRMQTTLIGELSEGVQSRLVFAMICMGRPNLLLLDEPTNHLDIEAIDALADAINAYNGGVVLVSHDFRLIDQVAKEIWVCENKTVRTWHQDIREYKKYLSKQMRATT